MVVRGEVWWSEDPVLGRRPVLVLSRDSVLSVLSRPLVAPLTTTVRDLPTEVELGVQDGLPTACAVSLDNVQPLAVSLLVERVTRLTPRRMREVCAALEMAVDCA